MYTYQYVFEWTRATVVTGPMYAGAKHMNTGIARVASWARIGSHGSRLGHMEPHGVPMGPHGTPWGFPWGSSGAQWRPM